MRRLRGVPVGVAAAVLLVVGLALGVGVGIIVGKDEQKPAPAKTEATVGPEDPSPFTPGKPLSEPPVIEADANGDLEATLVAETGTVEVEKGVRVAGMQTYAAEGNPAPRGMLGPTLHVQPGGSVDITFDNRLTVPEGAKADPSNCVDDGEDTHAHGETDDGGDDSGRPQVTNLHFHGMHVTPRDKSPFGDSVVVDLHAGESKIHLDIPADHDQGTYWYHAHRHGCTDEQVFRGLAGLLLVGDARTNLPERFSQIRTRSLALKDIQVEPDGGDWRIPAVHDPNAAVHRTVNGLVRPELDIRPGETQLWRLANVSATTWYNVALLDEERGGRRESFTLVAQDGTVLDRPVRESSLVIPPGRRFDVLVRGPRSGTRVLKTLRFDQGHDAYAEDELAMVEVRGEPADDLGLPTSLSGPAQKFPVPRGPTRRYTFDFDNDAKGFVATINNGVFDPDIADAPPRLGTTERWVLYNKTAEWHPFHIHQNDFRVVKASKGALENFPGVQDIVALPPGTPNEPSRVEILMPFTDFPGKFVFHCHILDHEDAGMMSLVHVRADGA